MQACPVGDSLYPGLHWHLKLPSMLIQMPLVHIPISLHSSWSVQVVSSGDTSKPGGQWQLKLPGVFMQRPFRHFPSLHSLISKTERFYQPQNRLAAKEISRQENYLHKLVIFLSETLSCRYTRIHQTNLHIVLHHKFLALAHTR